MTCPKWMVFQPSKGLPHHFRLGFVWEKEFQGPPPSRGPRQDGAPSNWLATKWCTCPACRCSFKSYQIFTSSDGLGSCGIVLGHHRQFSDGFCCFYFNIMVNVYIYIHIFQECFRCFHQLILSQKKTPRRHRIAVFQQGPRCLPRLRKKQGK